MHTAVYARTMQDNTPTRQSYESFIYNHTAVELCVYDKRVVYPTRNIQSKRAVGDLTSTAEAVKDTYEYK